LPRCARLRRFDDLWRNNELLLDNEEARIVILASIIAARSHSYQLSLREVVDALHAVLV
jgi:hypothetical protein